MDRPARPVNLSRIAGLLLLGGLAGCSSNWGTNLPGRDVFDVPRTQRGHAVEAETLAQVTPGVTRREDVRALIGSPSATGTFDDSEWYYISGITRQRPGRNLALEQQQVVVVRFDAGGTVQEVRQLDADDGREVAFVSRETLSPGTERTFLQRLFGNLGRLGPGIAASAQPAGPGSTSPSGR
jgi:outer membrane protein assembly factor BamE (lipoprotein component of BamABCDE complex)